MGILLKKLVWPALAAEANFRNICLLGVPHMCGNVLSSRMEKSGSKVGPMRTEKWY